MCVDRCHKSSPGHGAKAIGSGTRMTNSRIHPVDAARRQPRADPEVPEEHLENADDDLVALQCTARQERQRRGTITIGNPVHGAFEPNGYVNRSRDMVSPAVYPRLSSHHFDIQSTARKSHCHGYSCRLPALVLNHFNIQSRRGYHFESHGYSRRSPALVLVLNFSPL